MRRRPCAARPGSSSRPRRAREPSRGSACPAARPASLQALVDGGALVHDLPPLRIILRAGADDNYLRRNCDSPARARNVAARRSPIGTGLVALVAAVVLIFAVLQLVGVRQMPRPA